MYILVNVTVLMKLRGDCKTYSQNITFVVCNVLTGLFVGQSHLAFVPAFACQTNGDRNMLISELPYMLWKTT